MQNFEARFRHQILQGMRIERALDIGSYRGDFTSVVKKFWPAAKVWQFEADERQKSRNPEAIYALLGDRERECDFYTIEETETTSSTGSSIYLENTDYYKTPIVLRKQMTTIDKLMETIDFSGNWAERGLVKLDTQGSELDILEGARTFFLTFKPKYVLLEASVFPYNKGGPLISDVFVYMKKIHYGLIDVFDIQYGADDRLIQMDLLFEADSAQL